jgi:hypothetical protein
VPRVRTRKLSSVGRAPRGDSLATSSWLVDLLSTRIEQLTRETGITEQERIDKILPLVDRISKLRDEAQIHRALQRLKADQAADSRGEQPRGPELTDVGPVAVPSRRGRPARARTLR